MAGDKMEVNSYHHYEANGDPDTHVAGEEMIIYNTKDTLIGPLTKAEYLKKRKELHIPDDLQLEE